MTTLQLHPTSLLLTLAVALSVTACDPGGDLEPGMEDLELADDEPESASLQSGELDLVSEAPSSMASVFISSYQGTIGLGDVDDADVVMLKNLSHGYVGCDSSDEIQTHENPHNIEDYLWKVHRTDLDSDGTDELQFELIDGSGETGTYLKMNGNDEVFCGAITGIGDAAAWSLGSTITGGGTHYRKQFRHLVNYKQGQCLRMNSGEGVGESCAPTQPQVFNIEIVANAG